MKTPNLFVKIPSKMETTILPLYIYNGSNPTNHFDKELGHPTSKLELQSHNHIAFGEELIDSCSSDSEICDPDTKSLLRLP
ncbi:hypothetical protein Syun_030204 [Stephania yunnanensis]|uniref:Uncharacterized protein n=1 Tax=Stephania yunnanensis TaxID=152371 RepID=A0AAP0HM35_9MAGN